ncbi:MAG: hypothetical protein NZU63_12690 [Gemmataceae bacterium]|nr:hypothetical protein [Gemmataceae bacterium]
MVQGEWDSDQWTGEDPGKQGQVRWPPEWFARLQGVFEQSGAAQAIDTLINELRAAEDFTNLFYALLLRKRWEMGVSPFPTGPSTELPPETHEEYEQAIRQAGREVGQALLQRRRFTQAWAFYHMLDELEPLRTALEAYTPAEEEDIGPLIEIAWHQRVLPRKGFDWVLDRHGVCSAITLVSSTDFRNDLALRDYCIGRLVRVVHQQLTERLRADIRERGWGDVPENLSIPTLMTRYPELMAGENYHIDVSHLSSVVQMSIHLPAGQENTLAQELCQYGQRLAPVLQGRHEPPFEEGYSDYLAYLEAIGGQQVEMHLQRFWAKAEREAAQGSTYAAQVLVNLLVRIGREAEALTAAQRFLLRDDEQHLFCPGVYELGRRLRNYRVIAEAAAARGDPVAFLAALLSNQHQ